MKKQIDNLTGVRAFAALSVMLLHVRYGGLSDAYGPLAFIFKNSGLGVDVFFVLSGFILAYVHGSDFNQQLDPRQFLWARLARIYPVHIFMLLVVAFVLPYVMYVKWVLPDTWYAFSANVLLVHAWGALDRLTYNQASWSISAEWFSYLCFPLIAFTTQKLRPLAFLAIAAICLFLNPMIVLNGVAHGVQAAHCLLLFTLGFCAFRIGQSIPAHWLWRIPANLLAPSIVFAWWFHVSYFSYLFPVMTALLILSLFKSGPTFVYANPVSVYLGKISYSLYMSHIVAFETLRWATGGHVLPLRFEIPVIIAVAAAVYHGVEEPMRRLMRIDRDNRLNAYHWVIRTARFRKSRQLDY